jgi:imidazole glycerol-phosphate synthase subunit HisF
MYNKPRVIPVLSIIGNDLVKTTQFQNPRYLGDPVNAVKIFNGKGVDELIITDIRATKDQTPINFDLLTDIASQAFMPLGYGGGIQTLEEAKQIFRLGFEKIIFSTNLNEKSDLLKQCVQLAGSSSVVAAIDLKRNKESYEVFSHSGTKKVSNNLAQYVEYVIKLGVGEIIFTSIDNEGGMKGYEYAILTQIPFKIEVPIIINGGAGKLQDLQDGIKKGYDAVAASSLFVYFGEKKAVLINYNGNI